MRGLLCVALLGACAGDDASGTDATDPSGTPGDTDVGEGTLALTFAMDSDYVDAMDDGEEPIGPFWGSVYRADEVSSIGPDDGAVALSGIELAEVDMRPDGGATAVLFTTEPLPAIEVVILGFLDTDGNADPSAPDPDSKDPVTLPGENDFDVVAGTETQVEVFFGFLNP